MKQTDSSVLCTGRLRPLTAGLDANVSKPWRESFLSFHHNLINLDSKYRKLDCNVSEYPASAKKAATRLSLARPFYMHAAVDALHNIHVSIYIYTHLCVCTCRIVWRKTNLLFCRPRQSKQRKPFWGARPPFYLPNTRGLWNFVHLVDGVWRAGLVPATIRKKAWS